MNKTKNILILCTGNSCRSQIAEGWMRFYAKDKANVYSAGIETHGVNPKAITTMKEAGIDISKHTSNHINEYKDVPFDFIITVCDHAKENCPYFPSDAKRLHHNFSDPSKLVGTEEEVKVAFAKTREEIRNYCQSFVNKEL
ncbi:arsenate reductase ArsC [Leptospira mtsangambouensis]|uniref:Arsenate reductase ArsC n=1 Tax=Leptospira mtsangambouensis TaxID=2484912 RepID=A0ABY2NZH1_9LEPT|nr:arsenate reductase ArsC [Leptospira mtsangambouensis]TGM74888.1 arsenate reductase ArsC [Leptospira mtsangambouensis]